MAKKRKNAAKTVETLQANKKKAKTEKTAKKEMQHCSQCHCGKCKCVSWTCLSCCLIVSLRVLLGFVFLWAFIDKLFGLGFATKPENAWIAGGSPTLGFLKFGTYGPFASMFQAMAGNPVVDWTFMIGLLLIGFCLIKGIGVRIASYSGALMLVLMYLAAMPPAHNPVVDDHIIYALLLIFIAHSRYCLRFDYARNWWLRQKIVKKYPVLE